MEETRDKDNGMLKALEVIQNENQKLQNSLEEIMLTKKSLEVSLDSVENRLSSFLQEEQNLKSIHAINLMKIQTLEKEVNQCEEKQRILTENIRNVIGKVKEYKENSDVQTNNFTKKAEHLCELFLSAVHNETAEFECLKILDGISKLKLEFSKREEAVVKIKRDLEEFVFYEDQKSSTEFFVTPEEREVLMNVMTDQFLTTTHHLEELNHIKSEKQFEEFHLLQDN